MRDYRAAYAHLLPAGDIKLKEGDGRIHTAARSNHVLVLEQLIAEGADVSERKADDSGATPLYLSSQEGHLEATKILVECGAEVSRGMAPLPSGPRAPSARWLLAELFGELLGEQLEISVKKVEKQATWRCCDISRCTARTWTSQSGQEYLQGLPRSWPRA